MNRLFAGLYLDEDVSVLLAALLRPRGFEAVTTQAAGNIAASDERQLEYAAGRGLALFTPVHFCSPGRSLTSAPARRG